MMKTQIVITLLATALLGLAGAAQAGDRHRGHRDAGHYRGYTTHHYRHDRRHAYRPYSRHHGLHFGIHYAPRYWPVHGYYHHHDHYRAARIAAGAVLLGSIVHAVNHAPASRAVYVRRSNARSLPASGMGEVWYRTDSSGDCFEVRIDSGGDEVWTYVEPAYCE